MLYRLDITLLVLFFNILKDYIILIKYILKLINYSFEF